MGHRVYAALLGLLLACSPALAQAQDLDDLMATDPEPSGDDDDQGDDDDGDDDDGEGGGSEGGGGGGWDASGADEERPPGDPTAFALPKEEKKDDEVEEQDDGLPFSLGVLLGYGLNLKGDGNPWGFGFGLQGGYDLGLVHVGLRFDYYVGETFEEQMGAFQGDPSVTETTINMWELGLDLGLDIEASEKLLIRPGIGFGLATLTVDSTSDTQPFVAPGLALIFSISPSIYMGLDSRFQLVAAEAESVSALIFLVGFGMRF